MKKISMKNTKLKEQLLIKLFLDLGSFKLYLVKICPIFDSSPQVVGARYQSFLRVYWFLPLGVTNFAYRVRNSTTQQTLVESLMCVRGQNPTHVICYHVINLKKSFLISYLTNPRLFRMFWDHWDYLCSLYIDAAAKGPGGRAPPYFENFNSKSIRGPLHFLGHSRAYSSRPP